MIQQNVLLDDLGGFCAFTEMSDDGSSRGRRADSAVDHRDVPRGGAQANARAASKKFWIPGRIEPEWRFGSSA